MNRALIPREPQRKTLMSRTKNGSNAYPMFPKIVTWMFYFKT